jgi:hypothetical protein
MSNFLIDSYTSDHLFFTKPKKNGDYLISKVQYEKNALVVQFPKMKLLTVSEKSIELEFISDSGYSKKMYTFLSSLDSFIVKNLSEKSEEYFDKKIPIDYLSQMYNKFIKAPKEVDSKCTLHFTLKGSTFLDRKNNEIELSEINPGDLLEPISKMKYIVFSKDSCFVNWEIQTCKVHQTISKVKPFGFVEDPDDITIDPESDSEIEEPVNFF